MVGNLLHEDCLILKLKQSIEEKKLLGDFYAFPLVNNNDDIVWPGKYSTMDDIEMLKKTTASETAFLREYMLKIVSDASRVIHPEWIHYYDDLPSDKRDDYQYTATGIDLAISQKESADYTAMVSVMVFGYAEELEVYVLPNPVSELITPILKLPEIFSFLFKLATIATKTTKITIPIIQFFIKLKINFNTFLILNYLSKKATLL
jgi:hypothetical protein